MAADRSLFYSVIRITRNGQVSVSTPNTAKPGQPNPAPIAGGSAYSVVDTPVALFWLGLVPDKHCKESAAFGGWRLLRSKAVGGADHTSSPAIEDMGVDHGRIDVAVAEKLLNRPDVVPGLQELGGERMALIPRAG